MKFRDRRTEVQPEKGEVSYEKKLFAFWGDHLVLSTVIGCVLMILVGIALLFRPMIIVAILRYGTAAVSIVLGCFLLIRTLVRAVKQRKM